MAVHLFSKWREIGPRLAAGRILLLLDFDGTLAPIAAAPRDARLPEATRNVLKRLLRHPRIGVSAVSGRPAQELKRLIGLQHVAYCGLHGLEFLRGARLKQAKQPTAYRRILAELKTSLSNLLTPIPGVLIEDKGPTFAVHYRRTPSRRVGDVKRLFARTLALPRQRGQVRVIAGKKVFEITPPALFGKGHAVESILRQNTERPFVAVYIGDDVTDEDAFAALAGKGVTVRVGNSRHTRARYYLKDPDEVREFLGIVADGTDTQGGTSWKRKNRSGFSRDNT